MAHTKQIKILNTSADVVKGYMESDFGLPQLPTESCIRLAKAKLWRILSWWDEIKSLSLSLRKFNLIQLLVSRWLEKGWDLPRETSQDAVTWGGKDMKEGQAVGIQCKDGNKLHYESITGWVWCKRSVSQRVIKGFESVFSRSREK